MYLSVLLFKFCTGTYRYVPVLRAGVPVRTTSAKWGVHIYDKYAEYGLVTILHIPNGFTYYLSYYLSYSAYFFAYFLSYSAYI